MFPPRGGGVGGGNKPLKNRNSGSSTISLTPSPTFSRFASKCLSSFGRAVPAPPPRICKSQKNALPLKFENSPCPSPPPNKPRCSPKKASAKPSYNASLKWGWTTYKHSPMLTLKKCWRSAHYSPAAAAGKTARRHAPPLPMPSPGRSGSELGMRQYTYT